MMQNKEHLAKRCRENLQAAINSMRSALDDVERRAKNENLAYAVSEVVHGMTWGHANAFSSIHSAMAALQDFNDLILDEVQTELQTAEQNLRDRT
jgi:exonuclease VII small subunit